MLCIGRLILLRTKCVVVTSTKLCHKLEEIGQFETERDTKYLPGQCFLHRSTAYRGIVLCPWKAKVFNKNHHTVEGKPKDELYYQVLIDDRDYKFTRIHCNSDKITKHENKLLFSNTGLDYVSHLDIIPYKATNLLPIRHNLFSKLFNLRVFNTNNKTMTVNILPSTKLQEWKKKHSTWLNLTQVHKAVKDNVCITAMSIYMGRQYGSCWWLLNVKIENLSDTETIILQGQELGVYDHLLNDVKIMNEINLLCQNIILSPKSPIVQYFNYINLYKRSGLAWCYYRITKETDLSSTIYPILFFSLKAIFFNGTNKCIPEENIDIYFKTINL